MRKFVYILFVTLLLASLSVSAFASVMAEPCDLCSIGTITKRYTEYGQWRTFTTATACSHGNPTDYADIHQRRTVTDIYACDNCSYSLENDLGYEYRVYCQYLGKYIYS